MIDRSAGEDGIERFWTLADPKLQLVETAARVPHYVAIVAEEIAGHAEGEEIRPRLASAIIIEVTQAHPEVADLLRSL